MINSIVDLLELEHSYRDYLLSLNVDFDINGNPIFKSSMFLDEWPETIVPFSCRNNTTLVTDPRKTAICFFTSDSRIYPRLEMVFEEIEEYKRFMAVVSMDLTFTSDMEVELQQLIITINQLFTMILAVNDIKIIMNTRSGSLECSAAFSNVPKRVTVSSGFLGCERLQEENLNYLRKVIFLFPSKVFLYGKHDAKAEEQLNRFGFEYRVYADVHTRTKNKEVYYG